jgi:4-carboxymuconolactone decarboxylase
LRTLNAGNAQPTLEGLRRDFPFLADAITGYALGDVWGRPGLDHRTRQIAAVAAFAALGHRPFMKIHAGYALNLGVTAAELKEVVYLTTVHAGFPRAIEAAQTLAELLREREQQAGGAK